MKIGKICKLLICCLMVVSMTMLSACTTFDSFKHTFIDKISGSDDNTVYIGVFEPQTGKNSDNGLAEVKGIELANSIYNSVDGYKVELVKVDTQSSTSAAETAIKGLIKMKPIAIIGSAGEAESLMASKYIEDAKIPTIAPSSTNPLITQNARYYFRASVTSAQMGEGIAEYAVGYKKSTNIGIVTIKGDSNSTALLDGFNDKVSTLVEKRSDVIKMTKEIDVKTRSYKKVAEDIKRNHIDTAFITLGAGAMDRFFKQMEKYGLTDVTYVGTRDWGNDEFVEMMKNHPNIKVAFPYESVLSRTNSTSDTITEEAQRFQIQYANKYGDGDIPTSYAALGYDSYLLLINAIHLADSHKGSDVRRSLVNLSDIKGATGLFKFDNKGNTVRTINISTIRKGKIVSLHMTHDTTTAKDIKGIAEIEEDK